MRHKKRKLIFALAPLLIFFVGAEIALRIAGFEYESFYDCPTWWTRCSQNPVFMGDPDLFWKLKPLANSDLNPESRLTQLINPDGFRDDITPVEKKPGELRVVALGDSCTFGDGVANWESYSNVLEKLIRLAFPDREVNVLNAGVPGYTTYQIDRYLRTRLLKYKPDVVTAYVGFNDNIPAVRGVSDKDVAGGQSAVLKKIRAFAGKLRLYQLVEKFVGSMKKKPEPDPNASQPVPNDEGLDLAFRVSTDDYKNYLCGIKKLGEQQGFKLVIMTLPHTFDKEPHRNKNVREAAKDCAIPMLDLWDAMKAEQAKGLELYNSDGGHPNALGHRVIAKNLFYKLQQLGILPEAKAPELPPIKTETIEPDEFPDAAPGF